ncbi:unnamed protein product [Oncorhynchus mykiss]|uniref:Uncharacterized protein n=1 Tax=Oncorhynchus mykiss TaxID=8022 RepID=A0A060Y0C9_ONCMY|nr:unnamed protein product [Oncorhynchus mykiss]
MRIKTSQISGDRLSQTKSMVLQDPDLLPRPISRHRRNQSQHNVETPVSMTGHHKELSGWAAVISYKYVSALFIQLAYFT